MKDMSGISGLLRFGVFAERELGLEVLSVGRAGLDPEHSMTLEAAGRHLLYVVRIDSDELTLHIALLDAADDAQIILRFPDTSENWTNLIFTVNGLELYGIKDLTRPIQVGPISAEGFAIE
jgi:hypothetical protein